jgi:hypothetical protein
MYVFYRHKQDSTREIVMRDGAEFPQHLDHDDWYVHGIHGSVNGRTDADIGRHGYCDRAGGETTFGRRVSLQTRTPLLRRTAP